jgi:hypothetical protein
MMDADKVIKEGNQIALAGCTLWVAIFLLIPTLFIGGLIALSALGIIK